MSIDASVVIGENVNIGYFVVIEKNVVIGENVMIGNHVVIKEGTIIGDDVQINDSTSLGRTPSSNEEMARKPSKTLPPLIIGNHINIGSNCVIYKGANISDGVLIGDLASIRENTFVGRNTIIGRNAIVENRTNIGDRVTIQTSSYITADMEIEDEVFIGPCFASANDKYMGLGNYQYKGPILKKGAKIGSNATLLPGVVIGTKAVVGAGAVVTKDVLQEEVFIGNPAKKMD